MWYVLQTKSGEEHVVLRLLEELQDRSTYSRRFIPLYEEVRRSRGKISITFRHLFPGYVFIDMDDPKVFFKSLRTISHFVRILGVEEEDKTKTFIPVGMEDADFLNTLFEEGIMHVSYIKMTNKRYIEKIIGPLAKFRNHITKLDISHRRAIVEAEMFGKMRRIKFGLWMDGDPHVPWLERNMDLPQAEAIDSGAVMDIGIHPGDRVIDETGLYGERVFTVHKIDTVHRTLITTMEIGHVTARIELAADDVSVVEGNRGC